MGTRGRLGLAVLALASAVPAWAWEPGAGSLIPWTEPVADAALFDGRIYLAGASVQVLEGATLTTVQSLERPARAIVVADLDADGRPDLAVCAPDGVHLYRGATSEGEPERLDDRPCDALVRVGADLVAAGATVRRISLQTEVPKVVDLEATLAPPFLLAVDGDRVAVATLGGTQVVEHSSFGRSTYTARGPVQGLAAGPRSWVWSLRDEAVLEDVRRQTLTLSAPATSLQAVTVDDQRALLAQLGERVVLLDGSERVITSEHAVRAVRAGDLDADGCLDLLLVGPAEATLRRGLCAREDWKLVGTVERTVVLAPPESSLEVFVGERVLLTLQDPASADSRFGVRDAPEGLVMAEDGHGLFTPLERQVGEHVVYVRMWGGEEIVRVVPLRLVVRPAAERPVNQPELPRLAVGTARPSVRLGLGETLALRLFVPGEQEATFALRDGPEGMQVSDQGLLTYSPAPDDVGQWEIEFKVKGATVARAGFRLDVLPRGNGVAIANAAQAQVSSPRAGTGFWTTQHCLLAMGMAGGATDATASWQDSEADVFYTLSPVLGGVCEGGAADRGLKWFIGGETAPLYAYLLTGDSLGVHTLVGTVGLGYGDDRFFLGPTVSMGILLSSFGLRLSWLPFETQRGRRHGIEVRGSYIVASNLALQGMVMYGFQFGRDGQ